MSDAVQLEFDLWVEERFSAFSLSRERGYALRDLAARAAIYGESNCVVMHDPASMDTIVRYRI